MNDKNVKEKRLVEVRALSDDENNEGKMIIEGYAVVFEQPAKHWYTEIIDRNALDNCDFSDCVLRYNHNDSQFSMARTRNGSLQLTVDNHGLKVRAELIDTQNNRDAYKMVKEGLVDKMSFAFTVLREEWDNETDTRRILEIDKIYDVALVDVPFYDTTEVYARSLDDFKNEYNTRKELELEKEKLKTKIMMCL